MTDEQLSPDSPFTAAISAQQRLQAALSQVGIEPDEFPRMVADVDGLGEPRINVGAISTTTADRLSLAISASQAALPAGVSAKRFDLRYTWESSPDITHPRHSYDPVPRTREAAIARAWEQWPPHHEGLTMIEVCVREMPDGEWEKVLPVEASCDAPPPTTDRAEGLPWTLSST